MTTVVQTLEELVAIDSVSVRPNGEIADYLAGRCEELGLAVQRFPYRDDNNLENFNLVALAGADFSTKPKVELALVGHMVREMLFKVPPHVHRDDLASAGYAALVTAARRTSTVRS